MAVFNSKVGVDADCAKSMMASGARLVWVLGALDARRHALLQGISEKVYSIDADELVESKAPEKLVGKAPVLVCEHGITSLFVAQRLRSKGIEAFSLEGGVDGMTKW